MAVQLDRRTVAERTRSSHAWSRLVLSAALAFANGKPWNVHMPSSAWEAEHRQTISAAMAALANRFMEGTPGDFLPRGAVDARIITTIAGLRMPGMPRPCLGSARGTKNALVVAPGP